MSKSVVASDRKILSGVYEVQLSKNHVWRNIKTCRELLSRAQYGPKQHKQQRKIAELSEFNVIGLYCKRCDNIISLGDTCIKKKGTRGRSNYYHTRCAEIVHLL